MTAVVLALGCMVAGSSGPLFASDDELTAALAGVSAADMLADIETLASDDFEGRAPGTRGGEMTVGFLTERFRRLGLKPGNPDGSFVQKVSMIGYTAQPTARFSVAGQTIELKFPDDFVAPARQRERDVSIENSELVFVGYGVVAPEYGWDDFKGADLQGKTLVMLINDPQIRDPVNPLRLDMRMFAGPEMTYYGRWTYKYEMAARMGAAAAIIVHDDRSAPAPYPAIVNSWARENFSLATPSADADYPKFPAWIREERIRQIATAAGYDFDALKASALRRDFRPIALGVRGSFGLKNTWREIVSENVIARLEGSDAGARDEYVLYCAHWDHFGWDRNLPGTKSDQIYHGAVDNGSGVAALLALARAFRAMPRAPKRSILFLATTGEEQGLLGSRFYASNPLYPLNRTLAAINIDVLAPWGRTRDVSVIGLGKTTLDLDVREAAARQDRIVSGDPSPQSGLFFRSDQFEFARQGVPAIWLQSGNQFVGKAEAYGRGQASDYAEERYHRVKDTVAPEWDLAGNVENVQLMLRLGNRLADAQTYPAWLPGSEFAGARQANSAQPNK